MKHASRILPLTAAALMLAACAANAETDHRGRNENELDSHRHLDQIKNIVVIFAENRGFDNLYGLFPGANGIQNALDHFEPQKDFNGSTLPMLPPTWGGMTAGGQNPAISQGQTTGLPNKPFRIDDPSGFGLPISVTTRDLVHRFYNNQMQIDGGRNDGFAAYSDAGGLTMGYYDGSKMAMWALAREYTLADNFFMGAFGGSFLNHQFLICACAPTYPHADTSPAKPSIAKIDIDANGNFVRLTPGAKMPSSVLDGPPSYAADGNLTPADANGMFYAVNTMQPPYQPSSNAPASTDASLYADPNKPNTLPPQTQKTIGDLLSARGIDWAWYAGAWKTALSAATGTRAFGNPPNFQFHHQPFNYFAAFDPVAHPDYRAAHLKDFDGDFLQEASAGKLPAVAFYKPQGNLNQHPGYANVVDGDAHIAEVVRTLQKSPQWKHMLIVVTYDENGGFWDHVAPPKADRWGPGSRIPAIIISPYAKKGYVDHTQYDTTSILRFLTRRFSLEPLPGLVERDRALAENGYDPMGDLTGALDLGPK